MTPCEFDLTSIVKYKCHFGFLAMLPEGGPKLKNEVAFKSSVKRIFCLNVVLGHGCLRLKSSVDASTVNVVH